MIVITTPTGDIGSQVLAKIIDSDEPIRVIARDPSKLSAEARERVEVIEGSHSERTVVDTAFEGADSVFWLAPGDPRSESAEAAYVDFAQAGCEAFKAHGIERVVGISALGRGWPKNAGHVTATLRMDDRIAETGVAYRALACASLMENTLRQTALIKDKGVFYSPAPGDLKLPHCATRDVAAVAGKLLLDTSWTGVDSLPMMGPEDLSFNDMAAIMSDVLGQPVRYEEMATEDLRAMMVGRGASQGMAQAMVNMLTAKNEGLDAMVERPVPTDNPTTFRTWCEEVLKPAISKS